MRIRLLAVFFIGIFLLLPFGFAQTTASLDSIPARMHDVIVANEVPARSRWSRRGTLCSGWTLRVGPTRTQIFHARGFDLLDRVHVKGRLRLPRC